MWGVLVTVHKPECKTMYWRERAGWRTFSFQTNSFAQSWKACWQELNDNFKVTGEWAHLTNLHTRCTALRYNSLRRTNGTLSVINCADETTFISIMLVGHSFTMLQIGWTKHHNTMTILLCLTEQEERIQFVGHGPFWCKLRSDDPSAVWDAFCIEWL